MYVNVLLEISQSECEAEKATCCETCGTTTTTPATTTSTSTTTPTTTVSTTGKLNTPTHL